MGKIHIFLYSKAEYIWWILIATAVLGQISTPLFATYYLFLGVVPYIAGRIIKQNRWFYAYYIESVLGLGLFRMVHSLTYPAGFPSASIYLFAAFLGGFFGLLYFHKSQNRFRKTVAFLILFSVTALSVLLLERALLS